MTRRSPTTYRERWSAFLFYTLALTVLALQNGCGDPSEDSQARPPPTPCRDAGTPPWDDDVKPAPWHDGDAGLPGWQPLQVQFSRPAGFYTECLNLELEASQDDADIYYTIDGSLPNPDHLMDDAAWRAAPRTRRARSYRYTGPISLSDLTSRPNDISEIPTNIFLTTSRAWQAPSGFVPKAVVIRAQARRDGLLSPIITHTYFIDARGRDRYGVPVVSLSTERAHLFDEHEGIYVAGPDAQNPNYDQRGMEWERPMYFELFDLMGERPLAQLLGIRIHGGITRRFPQKSLRLYARSGYGTSHLRYHFFDTKDHDDFTRLILRNGGNDWGSTLFRDATLQGLVRHFSIDMQHAQPAVVFINGEYWGMHLFRDRLDQRHLETHHGIPRDKVTIVENHSALVTGREQDREAHFRLVVDMNNGLYASYEAIDAQLALPEFLDYTVTQCYAGNTDWPHNNISYWRYFEPSASPARGPRDGRWRVLLYDVDRSLGRNPGLEFNMIRYTFADHSSHWSRRIFRGLMTVEAIRHEFIQRMALHLGTTFHPQRVREAIDAMEYDFAPEMPTHITRWGNPVSMEGFERQVGLSHDFADRRPDLVRQHMVDFFGEIEGTAELRIENLDPDRHVSLYGFEISATTPGVYIQGGAWQNTVFAGVPLVIEATEVDVSAIQIAGDWEHLESSAARLTLVLGPDAQVTLTLP